MTSQKTHAKNPKSPKKTIYILEGPNEGKSYELKDDNISIGRGDNSNIQIKDKAVSRRHLTIRKEGRKYFIKDLDSINGTILNNNLLNPGKDFEVEDGDVITIGLTRFSFGKTLKTDLYTIQDGEDLAKEISQTAQLTVYKDRPRTSPKNIELIYKVSNVLMQSLDLNQTFDKILDHLFDFLKRIDRGMIILVDEKTGKLTEVISRLKKTVDETQLLYSRKIVNTVIKNGKPIIMLDTYGRDENELSESLEIMKVRSVMCVPMISKSKIRGIIYVDSINVPYGFREEDLSLITALSGPAAIAIENALLYQTMERTAQDRTENLKETEHKLKESENRFKEMFHKMSSGVIVYVVVDDREDFIILDINRAALKIERIVKKEVLGKSLFEAFPRIENTELLEALKKTYKTGKPVRLPVTFIDNEKAKGWREYHIFRLPSGEIVTIFDDITGRIEAEAKQKTLQEQLFASQKMESIGAFAGGTAHNFRNILQAISGNTEYLEEVYGKNLEIKDLTWSIHRSVEKGVDLINNLLHYTKRGGEVDLTAIDLWEVLKECCEIIDKVFNKNIIIDMNVKKNLFVKANHSLLSQAFMNLFTNARDAMPDGGRLSIEASKSKSHVLTIVSDTGHGMDKETMEKIFDPFFTLKDVGKGTGLGLSTTRGIVEQHKGSISITSKPGEGTTFRIYLPLEKTIKKQKPKPEVAIIPGKRQKILIIDDERQVLDSLSNLIKKLGYEVLAVDKPVEALKHYVEWKPDVVFVDRSMPEMDGETCIRKMINKDPNAKIVIISGYEISGPNGIDKDVKKMIKGYLKKPSGAEELSRTINEVLRT
ncbi:ATP-binding protein [Thermodesulfobacteriota bacterium]